MPEKARHKSQPKQRSHHSPAFGEQMLDGKARLIFLPNDELRAGCESSPWCELGKDRSDTIGAALLQREEADRFRQRENQNEAENDRCDPSKIKYRWTAERRNELRGNKPAHGGANVIPNEYHTDCRRTYSGGRVFCG